MAKQSHVTSRQAASHPWLTMSMVSAHMLTLTPPLADHVDDVCEA